MIKFRTKKRQEGELLINHKASPGLTSPILIPGCDPLPIVGEGELLELKIMCCAHCNKEVILNPERIRTRGYCPNCDRYVCDTCEAVRPLLGCQNFRARLETLQEEIARNLNIQVL